jgi:hypothetical protein
MSILNDPIGEAGGRLRALVAQLKDEADYLAHAPQEEGADHDWFEAQAEAYGKVLKKLDTLLSAPVVKTECCDVEIAGTQRFCPKRGGRAVYQLRTSGGAAQCAATAVAYRLADCGR